MAQAIVCCVIRQIVKYGHPVLRQPGRRISHVTAEIRQLAADMIETMYAASGVGLAAQQVGEPLMLTVLDVTGSELPSELIVAGQPQNLSAWMPLVLVNPQIIRQEGEQTSTEGCLSIPEVSAPVRRAARAAVQAETLDGRPLQFECTGLLARAVQHELDHLHGILFVERVDAATRVGLSGKLKKLQRDTLTALAAAPRRGRQLTPA